MMETIRLSGRAAVGFGLGADASAIRPFTRSEGFVFGAALAATAAGIGALVFGEGTGADKRLLNAGPILLGAGLGGGIAGAAVAASGSLS